MWGRGRWISTSSVASVVAVLHGIKQVRRGVHLTVVLDFLVTARLYDRTVIERELVNRILQVLLFHQHALERLRIEAERGAALQTLLVGVEINVLELLVREVRRHIGG